jgi:hypothetical protein
MSAIDKITEKTIEATDNKTLSTAYQNRKAGMERAQAIRLSLAERRVLMEAENKMLKEQLEAQKKQLDDIVNNVIPSLKRKADEVTDNAVPFPTPIVTPPVQEVKPVVTPLVQEIKPVEQEVIPVQQQNKEEEEYINMQDDDSVDEEEMVDDEDEDTNIMNLINNIRTSNNPVQYVRESSQVRTSQHKAPRLSNSQAFLEHTMQYNSYTNHPSRMPNRPHTLNNANSDGLIWL